ncbi:hypothetical protein GOQ04_25515, partial [Emticicia sp. ODNR4P]|nr:hypothetical protein [Emticicia sp. ODNR4P]
VNGTCKSPASSVTVTVTATPLAPTSAPASPSSICSGSSSVLSATCAAGTLSWYTDSGLTGTALASTTVSPTTTTTYYGACVNGTCKSPASSVTVTVTATPLAPTSALASPSAICSGSSNVLSATCATGTLSWYTDSGLTGTALASSTVSPTTTTTYYGACVNGTCKSPASSVTVTVNTMPTLASSNFTKVDPSTCLGSNGSIKICGLTSGISYSVAYSKNGVSQSPVALLADGTGCLTLSNISAGTYTNFIIINESTTCTTGIIAGVSVVLSDPVTATISIGASQNPSACGLNDGFIQMSGLVSGTQYTLNYMLNGTGLTPVVFTASGSTYTISNLTSGNYTGITVSSLGCTSNALSKVLSDPITATISLSAKTNPTACSANDGSFTLTGLAPSTSYILNYMKDGIAQTPVSFTSTGVSYTLSGLTRGVLYPTKK